MEMTDPYYVEMGSVLIKMKLATRLNRFEKVYFQAVLDNEDALEKQAMDYERRVQKSNRAEVHDQYEMVKMMAESSLKTKREASLAKPACI
jgi:hypothetical protein